MAFRCFIMAQLALCGLSSRVVQVSEVLQLLESIERTAPSVTSEVDTTFYTQDMKLKGSAPAQGVKTYATKSRLMPSESIEVNCFDPRKEEAEEAEKTRRVRVRITTFPEGTAIAVNIDCTCYDLVAGRLMASTYGMRLQGNFLSSEAPSNIDMNRQFGPAFKGVEVSQEVVFLVDDNPRSYNTDSKTYFGWATTHVSDEVLYLKTHELTGGEVVDCDEIEGAVKRWSDFARDGLNCKCPNPWTAKKQVVYCDQAQVAGNTFVAGTLAFCPSRWYCSPIGEPKDRRNWIEEAKARKDSARIVQGAALRQNRLRMLEYIDQVKVGNVNKSGIYAFQLWKEKGVP